MTPFDDASEQWTVEVVADTSALERDLQSASRVGRQFSNALINAFDGVAIKGKSVGDVFKSLAISISSIALKAAFKPLEQGIGGIVQGIVGGALPFAKGGAIARGTPVPFASGGVIASPIAFPMAGGLTGIAGERGAEAIMPLRRGADGRLGVAAAQSSGSVTINIATQDAESFTRSQSQVAAMIARAVSLGSRNL